jgi:RimJ/RimL family protein N-acetyltransferase
MKTTIYGQEKIIVPWVGHRVDEDRFGDDCVALGLQEDGELIAGVVFNWYTGPSISMHVAAEPGRRWLNRDFLYRCFAYPFLQLKCNRVTGFVRVDNLDAQRFDEHLGFKREGVIRQGAEDKTDFILYGMLKDECRWLEIKR